MKKNRYKIAIYGAVETHDCGLDVLDKAKIIGKEISKKGHFVLTGGRHGFPQFVSMGAKENRGEVIYFSPGASLDEHVDIYRLDKNYADIIIYTGFGYVGSSIFLTRSSDAVIIGCGKIDAIHEFTLAIQEGKPVGVLKGAWETDDVLRKIIGEKSISHLPVVFEEDPKVLVQKLLELIKN